MFCICLVYARVVNGPTSSGPNPARTRKYKSKPGPNPKAILKPNHARKSPKVRLGLKNLAILRGYFNYIFVHLRQKVRFRPEIIPKILSTLGPKPARTRPEPDPKNPARLTTLVYAVDSRRSSRKSLNHQMHFTEQAKRHSIRENLANFLS